MGEEWLDPSTSGASVEELVLRRRHDAAYAFASRYAEGARVVDVACGVGYGARILGDRPAAYLGVDRSLRALRTAAARVGTRRVAFVTGDVVGRIPVASGRADLVLAFQVIEHVPRREAPEFLRELRRICAHGGHVILTTPNRVHRLLAFQPPWNPYHTREFGRSEFDDVLRQEFADVSVRGLRADEAIERVERARVRQDPLWVYSRPFFRWLPGGLRTWLEDRLFPQRRDVPAEARASDLAGEEVTVDRFRVEEDPDGRGLDLVAVCRP